MGTYYAGFNLEAHSIFAKNKEVRRALNLAVNKKRIIDEILGGMGEEARGPIPPAIIDNSYLSQISYNQSAAKDILNREGFFKTSNTLKVVIRDEPDDALFYNIACYVFEDLKAVGVNIDIKRHPANTYLKPDTLAKYDMFIGRWIADTGDADNYIQPLFNYANTTNFCRYDNDKVTSLMNEAKALINPQRKLEIYKELQKIIIDDYPWIFIYHPKLGYVEKNGMAGTKLSPLGLVYYDDIMFDK
jgi:ABC-type transport system substrate-binding protein